MIKRKKELVEYARRLKLSNLAEHMDEIIHQAQEKQLTYSEFLLDCLAREIQGRESKNYSCRLKAAALPAKYDLDLYDYNRAEGMDNRRLRELRDLVWVNQAYNLLLIGPSGTGKTFIAAGLVYEALKAGYKAYLMTLEELLTCLKTKEVSAHAMKTYKRIMKAHLLAIDDTTLFPLKREEAVFLFKLVNDFQERTSLIITANKTLTSWLETLEDEAVTAALLDRLLYCCEIIRLGGTSYRMQNRKTIFNKQKTDIGT